MDWSGGEGWVLINGERWHARAGASLLAGQKVHVIDRKGLTLVVEPERKSALPD
jgi:membrane-bound ClpP family serine protease